MDPQTFLDIATVVTKLRMYPYFDIAHYILMSMSVREDNHPPSTSGTHLFSRKHPFSCWIATMLMCFAGSIVANLLIGEPLITPFKDHQAVMTATAVWYVINYSPFDVIYKLCRFLPFKLVISCMKEVQRVHKVHHAVVFAMKNYPGSYLIIVTMGVLKGAGYTFMRTFERLLRGVWIPSSNEILQPSFNTKGCLAASILFILERKGLIDAPHAVIFFGVVIFFVYFKLSSLLLGIHDLFVPFENLFCAVFMGGIWDALKQVLSRGEKKAEENGSARGGSAATKSKEE
ncbi:hypothetical protein CAPTEDRAFT_21604 [Capitella teleta]|uniref:Uncharacterized protein n=1 Tax=Capitella teleta TaxID=283909 RepID=R7TM38_CAPTE|nr:hypothetical protein CAPTEDRAFT_21604 [Capitella teleta]|eukprot:ELT94597.1 hypothetical protein CAPTEDRAFT_21604 [Capitella teleta]